MSSPLEWSIGELLIVLLCTCVGLVVTGGVFLAGQWSFRRLAERRGEPRRWGTPTDVLVAGPFGDPIKAAVVNRSQGGVAILFEKTVAVDEILDVRACEAPPNVPWVRVRARHCRAEGKKWVIGCQFTETVPWSVMVWFG